MPDPIIHSSSWIGSDDPRLQTPTYGSGEASTTTYYQQVVTGEIAASRVDPRVRVLFTLTFGTLFLAPLILWVVSMVTNSVIRDYAVDTRIDWLFEAWTLSLLGTIWQFRVRSTRFIGLRKLALAVVLCGTAAFGIWYIKTAVKARAAALASPPERVFVSVEYSGRGSFRRATYWFQRADGKMIDGSRRQALPDYASICASAQRLYGDHGFEWVRVVERSRPPTTELVWPIRKDECFSTIPLSSLPK